MKQSKPLTPSQKRYLIDYFFATIQYTTAQDFHSIERINTYINFNAMPIAIVIFTIVI
jgi:hypothetical protein